MNETNSRLGLKGKIAHFESALRLLGGAHTTGAIAAGAAVNLFAQDGNVKNQILRIAVQFVFGVCTFVVSYLFWFMTVIEVDSFLTAGEDKNSPDNLLWRSTKPADQHRRRSRIFFVTSVLLATVSLIFLISALGDVLRMAIHVAFGV